MNDLRHDPLDALLLDALDGPVPDDGFCDIVVQRLPLRRRRYAWALALGILAGAALCWLSLLSAPLLRIGWRDWFSGELSAPAVVLLGTMAGISVLAMAWTAAETNDR